MAQAKTQPRCRFTMTQAVEPPQARKDRYLKQKVKFTHDFGQGMLRQPKVTIQEPPKSKPKKIFTRQMTRFEFKMDKLNWVQKRAEKLEI